MISPSDNKNKKERYHSKNVRSVSIKIKPTPQEPSKTDTIQSELVDEVYDSRKLKNYATTSQLIY